MNDTVTVDPAAQSPASVANRRLLELWISLCNEFRLRERREIIEQEPTSQKREQYREELKWMIRGGRALLNVVSDPDFPETQWVSEISGKLHQLESSWKSLNNPMSEVEADAFIQAHFPDEASIGSPAHRL